MKVTATIGALLVATLLVATCLGAYTLNTDYIYSSAYDVTLIRQIDSQSVRGENVNIGSRISFPGVLNGVNFVSAGSAALSGSAVSFNTGGPINYSTGDVVLNSASDVSIASALLNFTTTDGFSMSTSNGPLYVNSRDQLIGIGDTVSFNSVGETSIGSGGGPLLIEADTTFQVASPAIVIDGSNYVSIESAFRLQVNAGEQLLASAFLIDLQAADDIVVAASQESVNFFGGRRLNIESTGLIINSKSDTSIQAGQDDLILLSQRGTIQVDSPIVSVSSVHNTVFSSRAILLSGDSLTATAGNSINFLTSSQITLGTSISYASLNYRDESTTIEIDSSTPIILASTTLANIVTGSFTTTTGGIFSINAQQRVLIDANDFEIETTNAVTLNTQTIEYSIDSVAFSAPTTSISSSALTWMSNRLATFSATNINSNVETQIFRGDMLQFNAPINVASPSITLTAPIQSYLSNNAVTWSATTSIGVTTGEFAMRAVGAITLTATNNILLTTGAGQLGLVSESGLTVTGNQMTFTSGDFSLIAQSTLSLQDQSITIQSTPYDIEWRSNTFLTTANTLTIQAQSNILIDAALGATITAPTATLTAVNNIDIVNSGQEIDIDSQTIAFNAASLQVSSGPHNAINFRANGGDFSLNAVTRLSIEGASVGLSASGDTSVTSGVVSFLTVEQNPITFDITSGLTITAADDVSFDAFGDIQVTAPTSTAFTAATINLSSFGQTWLTTSANWAIETNNFDLTAGDISILAANVDFLGSFVSFTYSDNIELMSGSHVFTSTDQIYLIADQFVSEALQSTLISAQSVLVLTDTATFNRGAHLFTTQNTATFAASNNINLYGAGGLAVSSPDLLINFPNGPVNFFSETVFSEQQFLQVLAGSINFATTDDHQLTIDSSSSSVQFLVSNSGSYSHVTNNDISLSATGLNFTSIAADQNNIGIGLQTTSPAGGDILLVADRNLFSVFARNTSTFVANRNIELYGYDDVLFSTFARTRTGYISLTSNGGKFDAVTGMNVGLSFRSQSPNADISIAAPNGQINIFGANGVFFETATGSISLSAAQQITYNVQNGDLTAAASSGPLSLYSFAGPITVNAGQSIQLQSTRRLTVQASQQVLIQSTGPITDPSIPALSFRTDTGAIILSNGDINPINFTASSDINIESGFQTYVTSSNGMTWTAAAGRLNITAQTGFGLRIANGDLLLSAGRSARLQSSLSSDVSLISGLDLTFTAARDFALLSGGSVQIRANGGDAIFAAPTNNALISVISPAAINLQADGVNNNAGGAVDGIFFDSQVILINARNSTVLDSRGVVTFGVNQRPIVTFLAGGDSLVAGFQVNSRGAVQFNTQNNFFVNNLDRVSLTSETTLDMSTNGGLTFTSTGTSAEGKDITFGTTGIFDLKSQTMNFLSEQRVGIVSQHLLSMQSTGTDQRSLITLNSNRDLAVFVDRTFSINAALWNLNANNGGQFSFLVNGDISISNDPNTPESIIVRSDNELTSTSNRQQNLQTTGDASRLFIRSNDLNQPITFETSRPTSDLIVSAAGPLTYNAAVEIDISATNGIVLTAGNATVPNSDVTFSASDEIFIQSNNNATIVGQQGLIISNSNPAGEDIVWTSTGQLSITADQSIDFSSATTIQFNSAISMSTNEGNINVGAAGTISLQALTSQVNVQTGGWNMNAGRTLTFRSTDTQTPMLFGSRFSTSSENAQLSLIATQGTVDLVGVTGVSITGATNTIEAARTAVLTATTSLTFTTNGLNQDFDISSTAGIVGIVGASSLSLTASGQSRGEGYIDIVSSGSVANPLVPGTQVGIEIIANDLSISSVGYIRTLSPIVTLTARDSIIVQALGSNDGVSMSIMSSTPSGTGGLTTVASQTKIVSSSLTFNADVTGNNGAGFNLLSSGTVKFTNPSQIDLVSSASNSRVLLQSTDITFTAAASPVVPTAKFSGSNGVVVESLNGSNFTPFGLTLLKSSVAAFRGATGHQDQLNPVQFNGILAETTFNSTISIVGASTQLYGADQVFVNSQNGQVFLSSGTMVLASNFFTADSLSVTIRSTPIFFIGGEIRIRGFTTSITSQTLLSLAAGHLMEYRSLNGLISLTSQNQILLQSNYITNIENGGHLLIPFLFPRDEVNYPDGQVAPVGSSMSGCPNNGDGTALPEFSFFYAPYNNRLCQCLAGGTTVVCF